MFRYQHNESHCHTKSQCPPQSQALPHLHSRSHCMSLSIHLFFSSLPPLILKPPCLCHSSARCCCLSTAPLSAFAVEVGVTSGSSSYWIGTPVRPSTAAVTGVSPSRCSSPWYVRVRRNPPPYCDSAVFSPRTTISPLSRRTSSAVFWQKGRLVFVKE